MAHWSLLVDLKTELKLTLTRSPSESLTGVFLFPNEHPSNRIPVFRRQWNKPTWVEHPGLSCLAFLALCAWCNLGCPQRNRVRISWSHAFKPFSQIKCEFRENLEFCVWPGRVCFSIHKCQMGRGDKSEQRVLTSKRGKNMRFKRKKPNN